METLNVSRKALPAAMPTVRCCTPSRFLCVGSFGRPYCLRLCSPNSMINRIHVKKQRKNYKLNPIQLQSSSDTGLIDVSILQPEGIDTPGVPIPEQELHGWGDSCIEDWSGKKVSAYEEEQDPYGFVTLCCVIVTIAVGIYWTFRPPGYKTAAQYVTRQPNITIIVEKNQPQGQATSADDQTPGQSDTSTPDGSSFATFQHEDIPDLLDDDSHDFSHPSEDIKPTFDLHASLEQQLVDVELTTSLPQQASGLGADPSTSYFSDHIPDSATQLPAADQYDDQFVDQNDLQLGAELDPQNQFSGLALAFGSLPNTPPAGPTNSPSDAAHSSQLNRPSTTATQEINAAEASLAETAKDTFPDFSQSTSPTDNPPSTPSAHTGFPNLSYPPASTSPLASAHSQDGTARTSITPSTSSPAAPTAPSPQTQNRFGRNVLPFNSPPESPHQSYTAQSTHTAHKPEPAAPSTQWYPPTSSPDYIPPYLTEHWDDPIPSTTAIPQYPSQYPSTPDTAVPLGTAGSSTVPQVQAEAPSRAVQLYEVQELSSEASLESLRQRTQISLRAAAASSEASRRASAYSAAASSAASKAAEAAERAALAATSAQLAMETSAEDAITAAEARVARAVELAAEAENKAASAAALATAYQDIAETQAAVAEKAANIPKPADLFSEIDLADQPWHMQLLYHCQGYLWRLWALLQGWAAAVCAAVATSIEPLTSYVHHMWLHISSSVYGCWRWLLARVYG